MHGWRVGWAVPPRLFAAPCPLGAAISETRGLLAKILSSAGVGAQAVRGLRGFVSRGSALAPFRRLSAARSPRPPDFARLGRADLSGSAAFRFVRGGSRVRWAARFPCRPQAAPPRKMGRSPAAAPTLLKSVPASPPPLLSTLSPYGRGCLSLPIGPPPAALPPFGAVGGRGHPHNGRAHSAGPSRAANLGLPPSLPPADAGRGVELPALRWAVICLFVGGVSLLLPLRGLQGKFLGFPAFGCVKVG